MLSLGIWIITCILGIAIGITWQRRTPPPESRTLNWVAEGDVSHHLEAEIQRAQILDHAVAVMCLQSDTGDLTALRLAGIQTVAADEVIYSDTDHHLVIILTDHEDASSAARRGEQIRASVQALSPSSVSGGIAIHPEYPLDAADLLQASRLALDVSESGALAVYANQAPVWDVRRPRPSSDPRLQMVVMLAEALDLRDQDTARHCRQVSWYCQIIAREIGMSPVEMERMRIAGLVHDIGKIAISDTVLNKPSALTEAEYELIKSHAAVGAQILKATGDVDLVEWIHSHHERVDGRGYPRGMAGDQISQEAAIIAVADSWEAMTADRVYRKAPGAAFAANELRAGIHTQFEERAARALLAALSLETAEVVKA